MKKLINDPKTVVDEAVAGVAAAHADILTVVMDPIYIVRKDSPTSGRVALVSGGGSGHEPLHGGFVGFGMLDAAVPGPVFTSPTPDPILAATKAVDGGAGVLHIVKNYTGDVLNFETAAELAEADGITVRTVIINDDVAVKDSLYTAGRRGVAGTVLVEKIAGAAAERGDDLEGVASIAEKVNAQMRTMGVALTACTPPSKGSPLFELGETEIEMGVGIHGEPGRKRMKMTNADAIVDELLAGARFAAAGPPGTVVARHHAADDAGGLDPGQGHDLPVGLLQADAGLIKPPRDRPRARGRSASAPRWSPPWARPRGRGRLPPAASR